jgi:hypothetical protein
MDQAPSVIPANILSFLRAALNTGAGALVTKGVIVSSQQDLVVAAALGLIALGWSFVANHNKTKQIARAIAAPAGSAG